MSINEIRRREEMDADALDDELRPRGRSPSSEPVARSPLISPVLRLDPPTRGMVGKSEIIPPGTIKLIMDWGCEDDGSALPVSLMLDSVFPQQVSEVGDDFFPIAEVEFGVGGAQPTSLRCDITPGAAMILPVTYLRVKVINPSSLNTYAVSAFVARMPLAPRGPLRFTSRPAAGFINLGPGASITFPVPNFASLLRVFCTGVAAIPGTYNLIFNSPGGAAVATIHVPAGTEVFGPIPVPYHASTVTMTNTGAAAINTPFIVWDLIP